MKSLPVVVRDAVGGPQRLAVPAKVGGNDGCCDFTGAAIGLTDAGEPIKTHIES